MGEFFDRIKFQIIKSYRRWRRVTWLLFAIFLVLFIFRLPLLQAVGRFLTVETPLEKADAIFVLGGNITDRPVAAAELYKEGWSDKIITLGANFNISQEILTGCDRDDPDSPNACFSDGLLMAEYLESHLNVPNSAIIPLPKGTSTKEESDAILAFAQEQNYKTIIVVSDLFHLRRIGYVFNNKFNDSGIKVILRGCHSSQYSEDRWWQFEHGLIMVNNEYIKLMYYWLKGY